MVLTAATFWGLSGTAAQVLFQREHFSTAWLVTLRMLVSGLALVIWYTVFKKDPRSRALITNPSQWLNLALFGVVGLFGVQLSYFQAIARGNAATATLLQYLGPSMIVAYFALSYRKAPPKDAWMAMLLALAGTILLVSGAHLDRLAVPLPAIAWGLLSALLLAFYTLQPLTLIRKYDAPVVVGWGMLVGGAASFGVHPIWQIPSRLLHPSALLLTLFVILLGTLAAFSLYLASLHHLHPSEAALLATAEPVAAVTASMLLLHVHLDLGQLIGATFIILAIVWLSLRRPQWA